MHNIIFEHLKEDIFLTVLFRPGFLDLLGGGGPGGGGVQKPPSNSENIKGTTVKLCKVRPKLFHLRSA